MQRKKGNNPKLHQFQDSAGKDVKMAELVAVLGLSENSVRERLRCFAKPPSDLRQFVQYVHRYPQLADFRDAVKDLAYP